MEGYTANFVRLSKWVPGVLYEPAKESSKQRIGVLVMHMDEDYLSFVSGPELAKRGYTVLCANPITKEGFVYGQPEKTKSVEIAFNYLKRRPKVEKVILLGHSSGGTLMSGYQAIAENGSDIFKEPDYIYPYPYDESFVPADGIMFLDSNFGNAVMQLFSIDPAIDDENSGMLVNEQLDLFSEKNGFKPDGCTYPREFVRKYQKEQSAKNCRLIDYALNRQLLIEHGQGAYLDDEPLIIPGGAGKFINNKLYAQDISLMSATRGEYELLHGDGSRTKEKIHSRRMPRNFKSMSPYYWEGTRAVSVRTFLSTFAIRTEKDYGFDENHVWGIEWNSTYNCVPGNVSHIKAPTLIVGMTSGWEFLASEAIYENSTSEDKTIAFVEGARHNFSPAKEMEKEPGEFGDTVKTLHDYVDEWLSSGRF